MFAMRPDRQTRSLQARRQPTGRFAHCELIGASLPRTGARGEALGTDFVVFGTVR
jgi:hypothetical protein